MPHALVQVVGDQEKAWRLYDETMPKEVKRTVLVDTFWDEKTEAIKAFETLGKDLWGVRLDTPASRRGNFREIIEEVKWELRIRGGGGVKIFVSGRLSEEDVVHLKDIVDGFGVGTAVAYPPSIDFSAKIVEVREKGRTYFRAKRGGLGGRKEVHRSKGYKDTVAFRGSPAPRGSRPMLKQIIDGGKLTMDFQSTEAIRERVVRELREVTQAEPALLWG
jgi:nicotinate phosphoribosyltransferase